MFQSKFVHSDEYVNFVDSIAVKLLSSLQTLISSLKQYKGSHSLTQHDTKSNHTQSKAYSCENVKWTFGVTGVGWT